MVRPDFHFFLQNHYLSSNLLNNIEKLLAEETGLPVLLADNPLTCVARGGGKIIEIFDQKGTDIFDLN